jgi:hypothetical protein
METPVYVGANIKRLFKMTKKNPPPVRAGD